MTDLLNLLSRRDAVKFMVDPWVPLTRTDRITGEIVDVICWPAGDAMLFHPLRLEQLIRAIAFRELELARWADDGGRL